MTTQFDQYFKYVINFLTTATTNPGVGKAFLILILKLCVIKNTM